MSSKILGCDPGGGFFGWALVEVTPTTERLLKMGVIQTEKSAAKRHILAADDELRRAHEIAALLRPLMEEADVLCCESLSCPRMAGNELKMDSLWGLIAAMAQEFSLPVAWVSPWQIKQKLGGRTNASKDAVRDALLDRYATTQVGWLRRRGYRGPSLTSLLARLPQGQHEHAWDALAAAVGCLEADVIPGLPRWPT